ncbi:uncharacterized protein LOC128855751 [Anastrepha ludens]|uniref:uncharacterized protein LOC128855751 n=1 Tax=Anastrepha ludens TaxID=28586 RepID=UPI0023B12653|nr:uncharacterized protein LOC128855751 [Anastrepha ludens]
MGDALENTYHDSTFNYLVDPATKNWREWLSLGSSLDLDKRRILMWIWPTENELLKFGSLLAAHKVEHVLSIGCGNGLFEWIVQESLGISVNGIEIDRAWWESKYSTKSFINLNYIDDLKNEDVEQVDYLQKCCKLKNWNFALMFCYFNDRIAFLNYLKNYKGNSLLIIGPITGMDVFTDPLPLEPHFPEKSNWRLKDTIRIGKKDAIAFYANI